MWWKRPEPGPVLVEAIPSRWDEEPITRAWSMLAGLAGLGSFSLEFAATASGLRFFTRAPSRAAMEHIRTQLAAAYRQAGLRDVPISAIPHLDLAWRLPGEAMAALELRLRQGPDLPIVSDWRQRADPLLAVLAASSTLRGGERVICQIVLAPAPAGWADHLHAILVAPQTRLTSSRDVNPAQDILPFLALLGIGAVGLRGYLWYQSGDLLPLVGMGAAALLGLPLAATLWMRILAARQPLRRELAEEKLACPAFAIRLRILAFGPAGTPAERLRALAEGVAHTYQSFDHPAGNGFRPRTWRGEATRPTVRRGLLHRADILNAAEIAGLWHLPGDAATPPTRQRMAARRLLPEPDAFARGCRVGVSAHQGATGAVRMPLPLLFRNQLVAAKTRRGKSTLLLHMAAYLMERIAVGERASLVVVDPHQDLAEAVVGAVPPELADRVVYLDLADHRRPVGLNLLDVALFPGRDRTAENVVTMLHRLWPENWGPRMEGALRAAVLCLHEANAVCPREEQYTLLDVVPMLTRPDFREDVLKQVPDRALWVWWRDNYERISRTFQQQTANPVTTKVGRFIVTEAARLVLGQPRSTIDPRSMLREGGVLVVNSAVGALGEGGAALMGATLLNLMGLVMEEQVNLPPSQRYRLVALVDESSTLGAADYQRMLSELSKYGASFVLVTQSLAKLDAIDRALRPTIFANIDGLTVFQVSAEDARYLVPELGGDIEVADLTDLDDYECYARWWSGGRRLPAFSLRVDPPPLLDPERVRAIARRSAERYGRPHEEVAQQIDRILAERGGLDGPPGVLQPLNAKEETDGENNEEGNEAGLKPTGRTNPRVPARSQHRDRRRQ